MSRVADSERVTLERLFSVRGLVVLVTGASGGIGARLAEAFAGLGARLALHGRSQGKLDAVVGRCAAVGAGARGFLTDLESPDGPGQLAREVLAAFGRIDVLINCAGTNVRKPILDVSPEDYGRVMDVNLRSAYFLTQHVARSMIERGEGGKVIHIGSVTSTVGLTEVSVYGLTKSALAQLTKTMAAEWSKYNIQVNCLCPGFIKTPLTENALWGNEHKRRWLLDRIPMRRPGYPDDLVGMAVLMASTASDYMTGQAVYVDGGFLAGSPW